MICDPGFVTSWLVLGSERSLLVDTGAGLERIRPMAEAITSAPLTVVNTHHHVDHVGGNREFDDVWIHRAGAELLTSPPHPACVEGVLDLVNSAWESVSPYEGEEILDLVEEDSRPRRPPDDVGADELAQAPGAPTGVLDEGDRIELGDRSLEVLHTPGHSADSICLLDEDRGLLFAGDTLDPHDLLAQYRDSSLTDYVESVRRLADLGDSLSLLLCSHSGHANAEITLIDDALHALETVASGEAELRETTDWTGALALEARVGRLSIQVAPPQSEGVPSVVDEELLRA
jgi:glyoxylase-like metal-dependent hydrolase (beta-lactamase superfamily II)